MQPVTRIVGTMAPLARSQVDTDQIIPKQFLKRIERTGFGEFLFYDWAHDAEGERDPSFILNRSEYAEATVLVAGPDFGTGSSREHAPWALADWGFAAIIAPTFGDIFRSNCQKTGLLPVVVPATTVAQLLALATADPETMIEIDLAAQRVTTSGVDANFEIDPFAKHMLLNGLDEIAVTLEDEAHIADHERGRPRFAATTTRT